MSILRSIRERLAQTTGRRPGGSLTYEKNNLMASARVRRFGHAKTCTKADESNAQKAIDRIARRARSLHGKSFRIATTTPSALHRRRAAPVIDWKNVNQLDAMGKDAD